MALFLDPTGKSSFGIALCARCSRKFFLEQLSPDPNSPGLMVCREDLDQLDPYRLPARQTERINLDFVRPDLPLIPSTGPSNSLILYVWGTEDGDIYGTEDDDIYGVEP